MTMQIGIAKPYLGPEEKQSVLEGGELVQGAWIGDRCVGTWGTASFSFYPSKNMTTSEGGMVLTNDDEIARRLRMIRNQGMNGHYRHEVVRLQLSHDEHRCGHRAETARPSRGLDGGSDRQRGTSDRGARAGPNACDPERFHSILPPVHCPGSGVGIPRRSLVEASSARCARLYYPTPIHEQPVFAKLGGYEQLDLPVTLRATREVLSLPVHPLLAEDELECVIEEVNDAC